ncbi:DUF1711-domain-containing protein [Xylona heveae TC161]|uniref:DUF1711-domain-containing protein n=1 Tax=Xylona heveae (strain CBS 132557 / TC161) TaxID=1328760 RepID=A0A165I362_XYLHT|nr:DUF1711-domain-containing protein [Xylona heveae TC161]KZF24309.1 DUF1711-domain-containing protein [Xylona heveae TC161]
MSTAGGRSTLSPGSTSHTSGKDLKSGKVVILRLSPSLLSRFSKQTSRKVSRGKSGSSATSTPNPPAEENSSESNSPSVADASVDANNATAPVEDTRRKGIPGPKPGSKRGIALGADGLPKPRGKPGPKKKPRLENGIIDNGDASNKGTPGATPGGIHKLGPKANQGAINAGLRALDRSGKPCRKWARKGFAVKSFTGVVWEISSWRTPKTKSIEPDSLLPNGEALGGDSDSKANIDSSAVGSEKSNAGGDVDMIPAPSIDASSPVPEIATPA